MKKIVLLSLLVVPAVLLAATPEGEVSRYFLQTGRETDFIPRVFNFIIFASLLYYLIANPIKTFFKERTQGIAAQLNEIEEKLQAAKDEKKEAQKRLKESEKKEEPTVEEKQEDKQEDKSSEPAASDANDKWSKFKS